MAEAKNAAKTGSKNDDVTTREGAENWLGRRIRQIGKLVILGMVLTPVAVTVVILARTVFRGRGMPPMSVFIPALLMWSVIIVAILLFMGFLLGFRRFKVARRVRPFLRDGTQKSGRVVEILESSRRGGGVNFYKKTIVVETDDGSKAEAAIEEMEGTDLPEVARNAPATVWTLGNRSVIGTSGSLFESSV